MAGWTILMPPAGASTGTFVDLGFDVLVPLVPVSFAPVVLPVFSLVFPSVAVESPVPVGASVIVESPVFWGLSVVPSEKC